MSSPTRLSETSSDTVVIALERLKARQQSEIQETERLIELISNHNADDGSVSDAGVATIGDVATGSFAKSLSSAASILYGFDYGFMSRSEGARPRLKGGEAPLLLFGSTYTGPPGNVLQIGIEQFFRNLNAIRGEYVSATEYSNVDE